MLETFDHTLNKISELRWPWVTHNPLFHLSSLLRSSSILVHLHFWAHLHFWTASGDNIVRILGDFNAMQNPGSTASVGQSDGQAETLAGIKQNETDWQTEQSWILHFVLVVIWLLCCTDNFCYHWHALKEERNQFGNTLVFVGITSLTPTFWSPLHF